MRSKILLTAIMVMVLLTSCDRTIHEYPIPHTSLVVLQLNVDRSPLEKYKKVTYDDNWNRDVTDYPAGQLAQLYHASEGLSMRIVVTVLRGGKPASAADIIPSQVVAQRVLYADKDGLPPQDTIHIDVPNGRYYVMAWADYHDPMLPGSRAFYLADTLTTVRTSFDNYPLTSLDRAAASGDQSFRVDFDLSAEGFPSLEENARLPIQSRVIPVWLHRPVGLYKVYATDFADFVAKGRTLGGMTIKCVYKMFVGAGFNVLTDEPNRFISTYSFNTRPMQLEPDEEGGDVLIFGDYLFTSPQRESNIAADFYLYDGLGEPLGVIRDVEFPVLRDRETIIRGRFLTGPVPVEGGDVAIDETFTGEYIYRW